MCGIAGFSGSFDPILLERMQSVIAHRGPDDYGILHIPAKRVGLAHRRLSIIDLSPLGRQPMWDATGTVAIVFNGEIYNYRELRRSLIDEGYVFKSQSDTEVLLNLYLRYGTNMLSRLNGIFAFALWDAKNETLFVARDGVGVKPLYYAMTPKGFLFASELKALLEEPSVPGDINPEAMHYYLIYLWCPAPHTMLKSVQKLEPGHALIVHDSIILRKWKFYELPYHQQAANISVGDAIDEVGCRIKKAVERQMVADVPVGAFLSGGLDSSSVSAIAQRIAGENRLQCFTIGFKDSALQQERWVDDLPYAQQVARHIGADLHTVYVESSEMAGQLAKMIYHLEEPEADPACINVLFISHLARENGIKVLLSGAGGDDIFTGYRRHYALMLEKYWAWMPEVIRRGIGDISDIFSKSSSFGRRFSKAFRYAALNGDERLISYFYWIDPDLLCGLYSREIKETLRSASAHKPLLESLSSIPKNAHPLKRMLYLEGKHFLADHNLNYTDKMSMAAGVEVRVPLLDPDLISLAAGLPVNYKQHGRTGKWVFRKAMEPYLPHDVIYRPKTGFGAPLRRWIKRELKPVCEDLLSESSLKNRAFFEADKVRQLIDNDKAGKVDAAYTIFSLICIEMWCRIFLDKKRIVQ
jgi:asparagine synthase (glutamine-hydrolysing)